MESMYFLNHTADFQKYNQIFGESGSRIWIRKFIRECEILSFLVGYICGEWWGDVLLLTCPGRSGGSCSASPAHSASAAQDLTHRPGRVYIPVNTVQYIGADQDSYNKSQIQDTQGQNNY